jgi:hypothetical protein
MTLLDPRVDKHLIADQGEVVIDEVRKHWAATVAAVLELIGGVLLLFLLSLAVPPLPWWVAVAAGGAVMAHAGWRILEQRADRFVITNMRVFRVHGILSQNIATMPLARILDISVHKPVIGRIFGFGHFIFESAAQAQGLREIRFVGDPDRRGLTIQRVIQQAGLRGSIAGGQGSAPPVESTPNMAAAPEPADPEQLSALRHDPPPRPPEGDWLTDARRREREKLAELRGESGRMDSEPFDPDGTATAPIRLPH